ncbi:hypothetical protein HO133_004262 [Letharia lupina]|uniref:DUF7580 domain-containing protein n=1 Tax=Letharia lupina TaxID=560253 RepID=A0A8H6FK21_9LECA|nr:uncharacterized protein HO133_004262 [Letharia lupina]KAF6229925.1 hypothetical protein HO133_004262 [Letharia lupina]
MAAGIDSQALQDEQHCIRLLMDQKVARKLQDYLRSSFDRFQSVVRSYERCLKLIAAELVEIQRLPHTAIDDLHSIVAANPTQKGGYQFRSRVRFTLDRKYFKELIDTLHEQTTMITQIVDGMILLHSQKPIHITESSQQLAEHFRKIQDLVRSLFTAIERGCSPGCHRSHEVMMLVDSFLALDAQRSQDARNTQADGTSFEVYFATMDQYTNKAHCHKALVRAEGNTNRLSRATSRSPRQSNNTQDEGISICQEVHEASEPHSVLEFRLTANHLRYVQDQERKHLPHDCRDLHATTNLDEFLTNSFGDEDRHMEWSQRALLALTLSCCILQMHDTSWIQTALTKSQVNFFGVLTEGLRLDVSKPMVAQRVPLPERSSVLTDSATKRKEVLVELAVLLLELWHQKPLQQWASEKDVDCTDWRERASDITRQWYDTSSHRILPLYRKAIASCLEMCDEPGISDEGIFQKLLCERVIRPLIKNSSYSVD